LALLHGLARDRALVVVTHEPGLFADWGWAHLQLHNGRLRPLAPLPPAAASP
jgi:energy-coupling factor transport system ATP-binding protein